MSQNELKPRRPLRLPFEKRKNNGDWGGWAYKHRTGILATVAVYLFGAIVFLSYRIVLNTTPTHIIALEFAKEEEPPEEEQTPEQKREQEIEKIQQQAFEKVQNRVSNENSKLNSELRDSKKSDASEIYKEAERVSRELAAGKEAYEKGLRELQKVGQRDKKSEQDAAPKETKGGQSAKVKGRVNVSYSLEGRDHVYLYIPAYQCQYGGTVVVVITVNRNGKVTNASVDKSTSTTDDCILQMAVQAAYASSFNASQGAPDRQKGTITYEFLAQ